MLIITYKYLLIVWQLNYCISDELSKDDPLSLSDAPWELRLASKLLRERSLMTVLSSFLCIRCHKILKSSLI